ncbi:hypothetical protein [Streptomyces tendae]|uniref:hypothetical protein n=1 Tax=Streptomyces tendae TaxID=1932 RepID=UPI003F4CF0A7
MVASAHTKTCKESHDPEPDTKLDRIEQVLERFPDRGFAFDLRGPEPDAHVLRLGTRHPHHRAHRGECVDVRVGGAAAVSGSPR